MKCALRGGGGGMIFGHQSNGPNPSVQQQDDHVAPTNIDGVQPGPSSPAPDPLRIDPTSDMQAPSLDELEDNQPPTTVLHQPQPEPTASPAVEPEAPTPVDGPAQEVAPSVEVPAPSKDDLLELKKQALGELSPLVDHLDQTAEEKFRTTMMLIQSTDNADLLKEAHTAAQAIEDEKARAQALLDIVNEINYFTHKADNPES